MRCKTVSGWVQVPFIGWTGDIPLAGSSLQKLLQSAAKPFVSVFMKRTGCQFFMHDTEEGQVPLLVSTPVCNLVAAVLIVARFAATGCRLTCALQLGNGNIAVQPSSFLEPGQILSYVCALHVTHACSCGLFALHCAPFCCVASRIWVQHQLSF